jgi:hypothetical protein
VLLALDADQRADQQGDQEIANDDGIDFWHGSDCAMRHRRRQGVGGERRFSCEKN